MKLHRRFVRNLQFNLVASFFLFVLLSLSYFMSWELNSAYISTITFSILLIILTSIGMNIVSTNLTQKRQAAALFLIALFFNLFWLLMHQFWYLAPAGRLFDPGGDARTYYLQGVEVARLLRGGIFSIKSVIDIANSNHFGYQLFSGVVYSFFGKFSILMKLFNVFIGAFSVLLVWKIGTKLFSAKIARWAAYLTALHPTLAYWSILNLKDTLYSFMVLILVLWSLDYINKPKLFKSFTFILVFSVLFSLRGNLSIFFILLALSYLILEFIARKEYFELAKIGLVVFLTVIFIVPTLPAAQNFLMRLLNGEIVNFVLDASRRYWDKHDIARAGIKPSLEGYGVIRSAGLSFITFLVAPLPWDVPVETFWKWPGTIFRILLFPFSLYGLFLSIRDDWLKYFLIYTFILINFAAIFAFAMGGMLRWQLPMVLLLMLFAARGIHEFRGDIKFYLLYLMMIFSGIVGMGLLSL